jgi:hypothetical protein
MPERGGAAYMNPPLGRLRLIALIKMNANAIKTIMRDAGFFRLSRQRASRYCGREIINKSRVSRLPHPQANKIKLL